MRKLLFLLLAALLLAGCQQQQEAPPPSPVYTDWSKLTPYQPPEEVYTRRYPGYTDRLRPAGDYGPLLPYLGSLTGSSYWSVGRLGLVTTKGEIVTDPVYSFIERLCFYSVEQNFVEYKLPIWLLTRQGEDGTSLHALAAEDGSWCTESVYSFYRPLSPELVFLYDKNKNSAYLCDLRGKLTLALGPEECSLLNEDWQSYYGSFYGTTLFLPGKDDSFYLANLTAATLTPLPEIGYAYNASAALICAELKNGGGVGYMDLTGQWVIPPQFRSANAFHGDYASATTLDGKAVLIDRQGQILLDCGEQFIVSILTEADDWFWVLWTPETAFRCYDAQLRDITPDWAGPGCMVGTGGVSLVQDGTLLVFDGETTLRFPLPEDFVPTQFYLQQGLLLLWGNEWNRVVCYTADGGTLLPVDQYQHLELLSDPADGTPYLCASRQLGGGTLCDLYTTDGELLLENCEYSAVLVSHGLVRDWNGLYDSYQTLAGEVVFRYRVSNSED